MNSRQLNTPTLSGTYPPAPLVLGDYELGGWSDIAEYDGAIYLSRQNGTTEQYVTESDPVLWKLTDLGGEPAGSVGELPICAVPTATATNVTVDYYAVAIDALCVDGDYLYAVGWREEGTTSYVAFWSFDGTDWTLEGQLQRGPYNPSVQFYGLYAMSWGVVASGTAGIYVLRGAGVTREDTGTLVSRGTFTASRVFGQPHSIGVRAMIPDVSGGVWTSDGDGVWTHYGDAYEGEPFYATYKGDIWRLSAADWGMPTTSADETSGIGVTQELVRLTDVGSVQPVAQWSKWNGMYEVLARIRQGIVMFGVVVEGEGVARQVEGRVSVVERNKMMFHQPLDYQVYTARSGTDMLAIAFTPPEPNFEFDEHGELLTTWLPLKFQGGVRDGTFYPPVVLRTSPDPAIWAITLEWADGNGLNRPQVDGITLEWSAGDGLSRPQVDAITLEWAEDDSPDVVGGDTILYLLDYDPVPAVAVRLISGGRLADDEALWALVRADKEDVAVDAWPSYQRANFGATVELEEPGCYVRIAIIRPFGMLAFDTGTRETPTADRLIVDTGAGTLDTGTREWPTEDRWVVAGYVPGDPDIHIQLQRESL